MYKSSFKRFSLSFKLLSKNDSTCIAMYIDPKKLNVNPLAWPFHSDQNNANVKIP